MFGGNAAVQTNFGNTQAPEPAVAGETGARTTQIEDGLADYVRQRFNDAVFHRRRLGLEEKLLNCLRALRCEYTPDEMKLFETVNIYPGLSSLKARAGESWINDILLNSMDKPWTLDPTPLPDLPAWMKEQIVLQLEKEIMQMGLADINAIKSRASDLKDASYQDAQDAAKHATENMEHLIQDQLLEGGWRDTIGEVISDIMVYPTAFVRAPVTTMERQLQWDGNKVVVVDKPLMKLRRIDPFDAFPSPDSSTTQNGHYFLERARLTPEAVFSGIGVPNFSESAIRYILERYPNGYIERTTEDAERRRLEAKETPLLESRTLDTLIFNGKVPGKLLIEKGIIVSDKNRQYEVEIWTIADITVKAVLNPDPTGIRPVFSTSYKKNNGSIWGDSVISLLFHIERAFNSFIRAGLKNAAFSAGPIGEVDYGRLGDDEKPTETEPYRLYAVTPDLSGIGTPGPAFRFQVIPSTVKDLIDGAQYYYKLADDISGIPAYVMGNPQVQGGGRTLGGLSMLMGNAAKGIKAVAFHLDKDIVERIVTLYYNYNMLTSKDRDIKADVKVLARGASGLLQRELAQSKMTDILQLLTPYATQPIEAGAETIVPPKAIQKVILEVLKTTGMDTTGMFPDPQQQQNTAQDLQGAGIATSYNRGTSTPVPLPPQSQVPSQKPQAINGLPSGGP